MTARFQRSVRLVFPFAWLVACSDTPSSEQASKISPDNDAAVEDTRAPEVATDGGRPDGAADAADEPTPVVDASDSGADGAATDAGPPYDCKDITLGTVLGAVPNVTTLSGCRIHHVAADATGVYFSASVSTCVSSYGCTDVHGLYATTATPPSARTVTNEHVDRFALAAGYGYFFDETGAMRRSDLASGTTTGTGATGAPAGFISIAWSGSHLYWSGHEGGTGQYALLRAAVKPDGSLETTELVHGAGTDVPFAIVAHPNGVGWFEYRNAFALAAGASSPVLFATVDAPEFFPHLAVNATELIYAKNEYGPYIDGGCFPDGPDGSNSCTAYPGALLGVEIASRPWATGEIGVIQRPQIEVGILAATDDALFVNDTVQLDGDTCPRLTRFPRDGSAPEIVASGRYGPENGPVATHGDAVYWAWGSAIVGYDPSP